jgi:Zn-dependent M28 family amino/carboxypeptidase
MRALINLDAGAPPAPPWTWRLAGGEDNPLGDLARDVASAQGWSATVSAATANSDYFPFARMGVPAVFIVPGPAPYQGLSADSSQALRRRWDHYHLPADRYDDAFPFRGLQRYAEYALSIAEAVDGPARAR